jgi:hypothetical protein
VYSSIAVLGISSSSSPSSSQSIKPQSSLFDWWMVFVVYLSDRQGFWINGQCCHYHHYHHHQEFGSRHELNHPSLNW